MSERIPRATAPDPTAKESFTESPTWEANNEKIGELVDKYLGETYVLDGKEYMVWFARPAGSVKSEMYISEYDLMGENGEFIEGISSQDLATRIDRDNTKNETKQQEQSDSGGYNLEDGEAVAPDEQRDQPSKVELAKRRDYIFNQAEWHLGREFTVGDHSYKIDSIYYSGGDGLYITDAVDIIDVETGIVQEQITIPELEKMSTSQLTEVTPAAELSTEQSRALTERVNRELETFDQKAAFERAEFEAFLYEHPELLKEYPDTNRDNSEPPTPYASMPTTIDMIDNTRDNESPQQKRHDAIEEFNKLATNNPAYEELRDEFMQDLDAYIDSIGTIQI